MRYVRDVNRHELIEYLKIDEPTLRKWLKEGLPRTRRGRADEFDRAEILEWRLTEQGIAKTLGQVAKHFGVKPREVDRWVAAGMPGVPGNSAIPGHLDLMEIAAWLEENELNIKRDKEPSGPRARLLEIETRTKELRYQQLAGEVVELDPISRVTVRHIHEAKAVLERIPDEVLAVLPAKTPARVRRAIRVEVFDLIDASCQMLADTIREPEFLGNLRTTDADRLALIAAATGGLNTTERLSLLDRARKQAKQMEPAA